MNSLLFIWERIHYMNPFLIEPYSCWNKSSKKKHWVELAEEEALYYRLAEQAASQQTQNSSNGPSAAGAGGVPPYDYFREKEEVANFSISPTSGESPLSVSFVNLMRSPDNDTFLWDFGSGSLTSTLASPSPVVYTSGSYTITLLATSAAGVVTSATQSLTVTGAAAPDVQLIVANDQSLVSALGLYSFHNVPGLTALVINDYSSSAGYDLESMEDLTSISFPNLISIDEAQTQAGYLYIWGNPALTSLSMPNYLPTNGVDQTLSDNALDVTSVNAFLARCVANVGYISGTVDLSGGTNAAPTGQGATDVITLTGRGVTVTTN